MDKELKYPPKHSTQPAGDGISSPPHSTVHPLLENLAKSGSFLFYLIGIFGRIYSIGSVNNRVGGELLAMHLLNKGFVTLWYTLYNPCYISSIAERVEGFVNIFEEAEIHPEVLQIPFGDLDDMVEEILANRLNENKLPDAIFAVNNNLATATLRVCHAHNIGIPNDCALVCFDELPYFNFSTPSITSIKQPIAKLCSIAFSQLFELVSKNLEDKLNPVQMLPVELIVRESSTRIPENG